MQTSGMQHDQILEVESFEKYISRLLTMFNKAKGFHMKEVEICEKESEHSPQGKISAELLEIILHPTSGLVKKKLETLKITGVDLVESEEGKESEIPPKMQVIANCINNGRDKAKSEFTLRLENCKIDNSFDFLPTKESSKFASLTLSNCNVSDAGLLALMEKAKSIPSLKFISLPCNKIKSEGILKIKDLDQDFGRDINLFLHSNREAFGVAFDRKAIQAMSRDMTHITVTI